LHWWSNNVREYKWQDIFCAWSRFNHFFWHLPFGVGRLLEWRQCQRAMGGSRSFAPHKRAGADGGLIRIKIIYKHGVSGIGEAHDG
jgi:hypothetical protein